RKISVVTVASGGQMNLFPTDLHGLCGDHYYISLRHEGKACAQVGSARNILLSDVGVESADYVYSLGKNHMQPLRSADSFSLSGTFSPAFQLPSPAGTISCRELELLGSFVHGIHKLLQFRVVTESGGPVAPGALAHVHNCFASWLYKNRISSNLIG
ncbi:MAG TPA: hypothetical protein VGC95_05215, partial [Chitinophagaceae bacterium]